MEFCVLGLLQHLTLEGKRERGRTEGHWCFGDIYHVSDTFPVYLILTIILRGILISILYTNKMRYREDCPSLAN